MTALVTVEEIRAAAQRLDGVIVKTPLVPFPDTRPRLLVKPESLQPTGSFKLRGAFTAISMLPAAQRERGGSGRGSWPSSPRWKPGSRARRN